MRTEDKGKTAAAVQDQRRTTSPFTHTGAHNQPCWQGSLQEPGPKAQCGEYFINDNVVHVSLDE